MPRAFVGSSVAALLLSCNAVLGIGETTLREDATTAGRGGAGTTPPGTGGNASSACTSHVECLEESTEYAPTVCIAGQCVPLRTPECPLILPTAENRWLENLRRSDPEPLILGAFAHAPDGLLGMESRNYDLALTEVSRMVGGIPAAGGKRRTLVTLVCQNLYETSAELDRAVDHLIDDLAVPGILAGLDARDLEYAFLRKGLAKHVFFMSPLDADRSLVSLVDDGLVWHMLSGGEQLAPAYGKLLDRVLAHLRRSGRLGQDELARVALVTTEEVRAFAALSGALVDGALRFNDGTARDNSPSHFRAVTVSSSIFTPDVTDYSAAIQLLTEFQPHVIVSAATEEFLTAVIPALEKAPDGPDSFYVLSPWHHGNNALVWLTERFPMLYSRMAGVNYAAAEDPSALQAYTARFVSDNPAFAGKPGYENFYDAAYYLIYAAAAAGPVSPLIGSDLLRGMRRLLSGRVEFTVGPNDLLPAFLQLENASDSIVMNGTMGPPNFDLRTGARDLPGSVWCIDSRDRFHSDVLRLDERGELAGTFPCFELDAP